MDDIDKETQDESKMRGESEVGKREIRQKD